MSKTYFYDTSGLVKIYHQEVGTEWAEKVFNDKGNIIIISELSTLEFYSTLAKKLRTQEITKGAKEEALKNFSKDCIERFVITSLDIGVVKKAKEVIEKYGEMYSISTLDALQLASCILEKGEEVEFVCADLKLIKIAELEGIKGVNPEVQNVGEKC